MIYTIVQSIHILVCLALIVVVLLQSSKGGGLAGAFGGGGGDQTVFGGHETATFLSKATTYLAVGFMLLSLMLAILASRRGVARPESAIRQSIQNEDNIIPMGESMDDFLGSAVLDSVAADSSDVAE